MYLENLIDVYMTDNDKLDMVALGLLGLKLQIPSPSYKTRSQDMDGRVGTTVTDRILQSRKLTAEFVTMAGDYKGSLELRDTLHRLLGNGRQLFVVETNIPSKRWKVYLDEWSLERRSPKVHTFDIPLLCEVGSSESFNVVEKQYATSTFMFNNDGDLIIDPRVYSDTKIEFSGASTNLKIKNLTTGEEWSWTGATESGDSILLTGVRSLKNGVSIFPQTNKKILTLAVGWNSFEITGASGAFVLKINTRFHFL